MSYKTICILLKEKDKVLFNYCEENCKLAKLFKNAVIFRCRQLITAKNKNYQNLTENELNVLAEFKLTEDRYKSIGNKYFLPNYYHFQYMFTKTNNVDYYNNLPMQTSQQIIKECLADFKSFFKAIKDYSKHPEKYTGKPKFPGYIKKDKTSSNITNQDAIFKEENKLKLPKTKEKLLIGKADVGKLKEVTIKPFYDTYKICIVTEVEDIPAVLDKNRVLGIDLGLKNIVSTSNNCGLTPFVINGNDLKSFNQWFNKKNAELHSQLPKKQYSSKKLEKLYLYRHNRTTDFYNKLASYIVNYCVQNNIGTIVIGKNEQWKNEINMGNQNNQHFCFISHSFIIKKIEELAIKAGIVVLQTEESYTSKASFLDGDVIPVFKKSSNAKYSFSGKRIHRGLYKTKEGIVLNADVNGASNIIKKAISTAFDKVTDLSYLYKTTIRVNL